MAYSPIWPKSQISNIWHDGTLSIRNFMLMAEKPKNPNFEPLHSIGLRPRSGQSPKFNVGHDGTLSIRNFVLIMAQCKNLSLESITFCTSARKLTKNKKCAPYVRAKYGLSCLFCLTVQIYQLGNSQRKSQQTKLNFDWRIGTLKLLNF